MNSICVSPHHSVSVDYLRFTWLAIRNRNKIFYAAEKNQAVAILRALLFPITMYDAFWSDYNRLKK